ncbi:MAG: insulinase family protein [Planctomycetes bacterium]|nr:insulinase family protein [Planctomycetota bacterium]
MNPTVPTIELAIRRFELPCGVTLLVSPRAGAPVFALHTHVRGGHSLDPRGKEGTAYLAGALADQGTRRRSEEEIAELLEPAAGSLSGDASGVSGQIAGRDWRLLCELACESIVEPTYPEKQFRRQKERLLERLLVERDEPRAQGELLFRKLVYGAHWLGRNAYGTLESVRRITRRDVLEFQRANWVGRRTIVAVCGDVDPDDVRALFAKRLARWSPGTPFVATESKFPERAVRTDVFRADRQQVHVYLGHLGVARSDPDYVALTVMDHVLGTGPGFTNRISMKLRDELGLAYSVNAAIHASAGILPGTFCAYIGTSPKHLATAIRGFLAEMRRIREEPVGEEELATAKSYLIGSFALGFQRASRRAGYLISMERHKLPADILERLPREYAAITADDVRRVAQKHLHPDACVVAATGPLDAKALARSVSPARAVRRSRA